MTMSTMALNAAWHRQHPMPKPATPAQRLDWHLAHAKQCGCHDPSPQMLAELRRQARATRVPAVISDRARRHRPSPPRS
jgi:hypothetical protein